MALHKNNDKLSMHAHDLIHYYVSLDFSSPIHFCIEAYIYRCIDTILNWREGGLMIAAHKAYACYVLFNLLYQEPLNFLLHFWLCKYISQPYM